jgi:hypothetical protein
MASVNIPIVSEFNSKGIDRAIKEFKSLEGVGKKAQFALKKAALPATAALAGLAAAAGPAISAASDLGENLSKVGVIFGDSAKEIEDFASTAATKLGQSKNAVLQAAGTFGTFGKAAGLGGEDLATFSNDFTALASDLASFNNTTPEEAINAIGSALRGESEPLRQYGVLLNDAKLKAAALELGIYSGSGALTDQQKILAAQKVIYDETGDAQGDFARTSDGLANSQRQLSAQMEDLQVSIGQALLPVVEAILPLVKDFAQWAADNPQTFTYIAGAIGLVAAAIIATNIAMALNPFALIAAGIALLIAGIVMAYNKFEWFRDGIKAIVNTVIGFFAGMVNAAIKVPSMRSFRHITQSRCCRISRRRRLSLSLNWDLQSLQPFTPIRYSALCRWRNRDPADARSCRRGRTGGDYPSEPIQPGRRRYPYQHQRRTGHLSRDRSSGTQ